jgi:hypothetical protein
MRILAGLTIAIIALLVGFNAQAQDCRVADPTGTPLNIRTFPDGKTIVGTLKNGAPVRILDTKDKWAYIGLLPEENKTVVPTGWVYREYLDCTARIPSTTAGTNSLLGCFARTYDKTHLAQHPDQTVTAVKLKIFPSPPDPERLWFSIRMQRRGEYKALHNEGLCIQESSGTRCYVECDGGGVTVTPRSNSTVLMRLEEIRMAPCGTEDADNGTGIVVTGGKDDHEFLLKLVDDAVCSPHDAETINTPSPRTDTKPAAVSPPYNKFTPSGPADPSFVRVPATGSEKDILTASPFISSNTLAEAPTRFGTVALVKDCDKSRFCSQASATLGSKTIIVANSPNEISVDVVGIFPTSDGDLVILEIPGGRAGLDRLVALLVQNATDLAVISEFYSADHTPFHVERQDDSLIFDLGFENKKRKMAIYDHGKLTITFAGTEQVTLSKSDCEYLLNTVKDCLSLKDCGNVDANFSMSVQRNLAALDNKPGFHTDDFYGRCRRICTTRKYDLQETRKRLCGY